MRDLRLLLLAVLAAGSLGSVGNNCSGLGVPEPDACTEVATSATVATLELGDGDIDDLFHPWGDEAGVTLVYGGQGSPMIRTRLRVTGASAKACMVQRVRAYEGDKEVARTYGPVGFYAQDDGSRITRTVYLVLDEGATGDGARVRVEAEVGSQTASRTVRIQPPR